MVVDLGALTPDRYLPTAVALLRLEVECDLEAAMQTEPSYPRVAVSVADACQCERLVHLLRGLSFAGEDDGVSFGAVIEFYRLLTRGGGD